MTKFVRMLLSLMIFIVPMNFGFCKDTPKVIRNFTNAYVTDLNVALRLSKETKQKVVVVFSADWCGYCNSLKKDLINLKGFENKILCIIDVDDAKKLARQYKAKTLPTSVILDENGNETDRISGYEKSSYQKWLTNF